MSARSAQEHGWTEVRLVVPLGWAELAGEWLAGEPCTSVLFGTPSIGSEPPPPGTELVRSYLSARDDAPELRARLAARIAAGAAHSGVPELAGLEPRFKELPPEDFARSWEKRWKPFRAGRLCLLPPWDERELAPGEKRLSIVPGGSFGSGRHATTRTCLRVLDARVRGGERVLDAGTGSGILAVAAVLLGAERALGFDLDPGSAASAGALASDNGVAQRCDFRRGGFEVLGEDDGPFEVVLANIYSDVLIAQARRLRERLAPGGWFAFSGCPLHHLEATRAAILAAGLELHEIRRRGRWHTFVGGRG